MPKTLGELIKEIVEFQGLSQDEFGRLINTSRQNVADIYTRKKIDIDLLITISTVLKKDLLKFYYETREPLISLRKAEIEALTADLNQIIADQASEIAALKEKLQSLENNLSLKDQYSKLLNEQVETLQKFNDTQNEYINVLKSRKIPDTEN